METRKLIAFGTSSFVISVPKSWVKKNLLKKGDLLHIEDKKDELTIYPSHAIKREEPKRILIEIDNKKLNLIKTEIVSAYLNNYDILDIAGRTLEEIAPEIKKILRNLTGIEIIQQTATKITAKDLINLKEISIQTILRRMDNITRSMILDSIDSIETDHYESIFERDMDVNRLVFLAYRVIRGAMINPKMAKYMVMSNNELMFSRDIICEVEKMSDHTKRIARHLRGATSLTKEERRALMDLYQRIMKDYLAVMKAHYKRDAALAFKVEVENKDVIRMCNEYKRVNDPVDTSRIIEHFKGMRNAIRCIARSTLGIEPIEP